jgi:Flp pilus assembly protein TadD
VKGVNRLTALATAAVFGLIGLAACNANKTAALPDPATLFAPGAAPPTTNFSGSYLAARYAQHRQDWDAAQGYMARVLEHDADNTGLRERTFLLTLGAGNFEKAKQLAAEILAQDQADDLANLVFACDSLAHGDYKAAQARIDAVPEQGFGEYTKPLLSAWILAGQGRKEEALKLLAASASPEDPTYRIHAGMIEEIAGNPEAAAEHYKIAMANGLTLHSAVQIGNFFERQAQPRIARMIYDGLAKLYPFNPFIAALQHPKDGPVPPAEVRTAADGAAYALYDLSTLLYEKRAYDSALVYNGLVQMLTPGSSFTMMMAGDIAALHQQFGKAVESYNAIPEASPLHWLARMRVAETYEASGHADLAAALLGDIAKQPSMRINALVSLGDMYRRHDEFSKALKSYDAALAETGPVTEDTWQLIYARGMSLERMGQWSLAEKDLLKALEFQPDNPMILNFIGYSWVDKGINVEKAMDFLRRAVALKPDDGYILDSYGWAFYRAGQYDKAVKWIEQAVAQVPDDATILDHLGDAYWQAGRKNEARFKWRRASELNQDKSFREGEQAKIRDGLPAQQAAPHPAHAKEAKL